MLWTATDKDLRIQTTGSLVYYKPVGLCTVNFVPNTLYSVSLLLSFSHSLTRKLPAPLNSIYHTFFNMISPYTCTCTMYSLIQLWTMSSIHFIWMFPLTRHVHDLDLDDLDRVLYVELSGKLVSKFFRNCTYPCMFYTWDTFVFNSTVNIATFCKISQVTCFTVCT